MNVKVILQVAYMSAFRPSFCLNGSFARVLKILFTDTHTRPITLPLHKRGVKIHYNAGRTYTMQELVKEVTLIKHSNNGFAILIKLSP